jgi:hypothetical protein|tara:strand:- start:357 stop:626 length:270 start_codon:yes stop_codon:yes gene_type:complete
MGANSIHYDASKKQYKSAREAYQLLREEETYEHGHDPYNGTISTCSLEGKISEPKDDDAYEEALDNIDKRECKYYETDTHYVFIGWAAC